MLKRARGEAMDLPGGGVRACAGEGGCAPGRARGYLPGGGSPGGCAGAGDWGGAHLL